MEFEPGSKFSYNNSGYFLLGAIIEKVTGQTYEQVLKEKILNPLGMKNGLRPPWNNPGEARFRLRKERRGLCERTLS